MFYHYRNGLTFLFNRKAMSRCSLLTVIAAPLAILLLLTNHLLAVDLNPVQYVKPFIGTEARVVHNPQDGGFDSGNVFPGASYPHGMVQWSPDTTNDPGGYRYNQSMINGFGLTHFSGRGCRAYQDFPFMPTGGPIDLSPAHTGYYASSFSHGRETASPGYYSVHLDSTNIQVELAVTPRTGFGRFTYPPSHAATMLINAGGSATGNTTASGVQIIGSDMVVGSATSGHFCGMANTYTVYFAAQFDQSFTQFGTWNGSTITANGRSSDGSQSGAYLTFDTTRQSTIQVKVGISFVSVSNAQENVQQENPLWDFPAVKARASAAWNAILQKIQVTGGTTDEKTIFYTALYHTMFHPNIFSDVNGQYIGFDHRVHTAQGYTQYENFPGWDMYRSLIALEALLEPHEVGDMVQSLLADAQQGGGGLPRWEVANDNSAGMVGDSQDVVIATSYAFGVRNFDRLAALRAMNIGASHPGTKSGKYSVRQKLKNYLKLGYVAAPTAGSASITLEYATDDFALAQYAKELGDTTLYNTYMARSQNWRNIFNAAMGYIEPRNKDGSFIPNFSPTSGNGFVEGDSSQYSWMVPYDLPGLFDAMGGNGSAIQRLDTHFTQLNAGGTGPYAYMGNEPEFAVPWEYDFAGAPSRTQEVVRRIEQSLFLATPDGLPGNDDGGAMSSWYVFAAMGLYPEIPGVAGFAIGSPLFSSITVHLGNGNLLQITGLGAAEDAPYVQSLALNGQPFASSWLPFQSIMNGATLQFTLGTAPGQGALTSAVNQSISGG